MRDVSQNQQLSPFCLPSWVEALYGVVEAFGNNCSTSKYPNCLINYSRVVAYYLGFISGEVLSHLPCCKRRVDP